MSNKQININKYELNIVDYMSIVNEIAEEFFYGDGIYVPHIGKTYSMLVFYNNFYNVDNKIETHKELEPYLNNSDFLTKYNEALKGDGMVRLDFANAYSDAMKIVDVKKTTAFSITEVIKKLFNEINLDNIQNSD